MYQIHHNQILCQTTFIYSGTISHVTDAGYIIPVSIDTTLNILPTASSKALGIMNKQPTCNSGKS